LASPGGLQLAESPKAKELQVKGTQVLEELKAADAKNFDVTYLHGQVEQHGEVLSLIKDQLQPAVSDPTLRDHLANARAMVGEHLDQCEGAAEVAQRASSFSIANKSVAPGSWPA
jgi:predicted outer membrane protein